MPAVELSADSLNNKALSLLDLGMKEEADRIWQTAVKNDNHHRDTVFNYALFRWRTGRIDPLQAIRQLRLANNGEKNPEDEEEILPGITAGGIRTDDFDPVTLESRLVPGVFACGEVLDVDGDCGGYNLQWAWASGRKAGRLGT